MLNQISFTVLRDLKLKNEITFYKNEKIRGVLVPTKEGLVIVAHSIHAEEAHTLPYNALDIQEVHYYGVHLKQLTGKMKYQYELHFNNELVGSATTLLNGQFEVRGRSLFFSNANLGFRKMNIIELKQFCEENCVLV